MSTEEQTIALKELLGIATNKAATTRRSSISTNSRTATGSTGTTAIPVEASMSTPKQKKSKTKADANSKEKRISQKKNQQFVKSSSNVSGSGNGNGRTGTEKRTSAQKTAGKKATKRSQSNVPTTSTSQNEQKENQNYAWSAFQSPPDASNLPLPAFDSLSFDNDEVPSKVVVIPSATSATPAVAGDWNDTNAGTSSTTQQHTDMMLAETTTGISGINIANLALQSTTTNINKDQSNGGSNVRDVVVAGGDVNTSSSSNGFLSKIKDPKESMTSSELHSVAMSTPNKCEYQPTEDDNDDPLLMLMNPSYGNSSRHGSIDRNLLTPPMQRTFSDPSIIGHDASYGSGMMMSPVNNPIMTPFPIAPQPFITIQVQVPSQLFPGRRMMVPVAPGCNVPVIVPEGIQGGMVIPVTVPHVYATGAGGAAPMPHMVPMPMTSVQQTQHLAAYNHNYNNAAYNHQPPRQNFNSHVTGTDKHVDGVTESWADKVAATKPNPM
mmetsp:Transcript_14318/g.26884  ORF Transcript_14318/g.26884 Transcript_14318/m.26884 type:complete len:494 (+) Transcript_14318:172-1653(+)